MGLFFIMVQFHLSYVKTAVKTNPDAKSFLQRFDKLADVSPSCMLSSILFWILLQSFTEWCKKLGINVFVPF